MKRIDDILQRFVHTPDTSFAHGRPSSSRAGGRPDGNTPSGRCCENGVSASARVSTIRRSAVSGIGAVSRGSTGTARPCHDSQSEKNFEHNSSPGTNLAA